MRWQSPSARASAPDLVGATDQGHRAIVITHDCDLPHESELCVEVIVADTGAGIDPTLAAHLFTAFVSSKSEGMGLGLSICRTIVEANGGRIWAEPRKGGGTEFHFTLVSAKGEERDDG